MIAHYIKKHLWLTGIMLMVLVSCEKAEETPSNNADKVENFWQKASSPNTPRSQGILGQLADGRILLTSGFQKGNTAMAGTEIYDPATDKWATVSAFSPECSAGTFFRLRNGKMILLNYGSALVNVFDPITSLWTTVGQHGGQSGDWLTVSGACELENGNVILVGRSSLTVWDQHNSFVTYDMKSGSSALRFATVHQLPGTNQFIVFGNQNYQGLGIIYELNDKAGNAPKPLTDPILNFSGIKMQSQELGNQLLLMGGSNGTHVGNSANAPTIFNVSNKQYTRLKGPQGETFGISEIPIAVSKDTNGKIWFADKDLDRYYFDPATQAIHRILNTIDSTKKVPLPFTSEQLNQEGSGAVLLQDGNLMVYTVNEAWITK